jgi:hypothetical protein
MAELYACPFCREMFAQDEVERCPSCEIDLRPLTELPPSHDASLLDEPLPQEPPEDQVLPWSYLGRGRGALILLSLAGLAAFFAPWLHETSPEIRTWSGMEFSRHLGWIWGGGLGWFVMLPLVASRRTIRQMRGARVAAAFLAATVLVTVVARLAVTPTPDPRVALRFVWGWGLYAAGLLSALALLVSFRFGGSLKEMSSQTERRGDETLH